MNQTLLLNNDYKTDSKNYKTDIYNYDILAKSSNEQSKKATDFADGVKNKENSKFTFEVISLAVIIILTFTGLFGKLDLIFRV